MDIVSIYSFLPQICLETDNPSGEEGWEARLICGCDKKKRKVTFYFQVSNESKQEHRLKLNI